MSKGIYGYWDNQKGYVVYIGQTGDLEYRKKTTYVAIFR